MRLHRLLELVASAFLAGFAAWSWIEVLGSGTLPGLAVLVRGMVLELIAAILAIDMVLGGWIPAKIVLALRGMRGNYRLAPYRLGAISVNNPAALFMAGLFVFDVVAGSVALLRGVWWLGLCVLAIGVGGAGFFTYKAFFEPTLSTIRIRSPEARRIAPLVPWYVHVARIRLLGRRPFEALGRILVSKLSLMCLSEEAGAPWSSRELELLVGALTGLGLIVGVAFTVPVVLVFRLYGLLLLLSVPVPVLSLLAALYYRRRMRAKLVDEDLPWLALAGSLAQPAGLLLPWVLEELGSDKDLFPGLSREADELRRRQRVLGEDPVSALNTLARGHPSDSFKNLVLGYVSVLHSGGDLSSFLEDRARLLVSGLRLRLRRFVEDAVLSGETATAFLMLGVLLVLGGAMVLPYNSILILRFLDFALLPAMFLAVYLMAEASQPRLRDRFEDRGPLVAGSLGLGAGTLIGVVLGLEGWQQVLLAAAVAAGIYGLYWRVQRRIVELEEEELERFLRDLVELRKAGYPVGQSLRILYRKGDYNQVFRERLGEAVASLERFGNPSVARAKSWLFRLAFKLLSVSEQAGGALPRDLERILDAVRTHRGARREARSLLRRYETIAYASPPVLAFGVAFLHRMLEKYNILVSSAPLVAGLSLVPSHELLAEARLAVVLSSLALALITSKLVDRTLRNTLRALGMLILAFISLTVAPAITSLLLP